MLGQLVSHQRLLWAAREPGEAQAQQVFGGWRGFRCPVATWWLESACGTLPGVLSGAWHWGPSDFGSCPLCGLGEGGAEHLLLWCPAVALAWCALAAGRGHLLAEVVAGAAGPMDAAARLVHQASFVHFSLQRRATMQWEAAGRWLMRARGPRGYRAWAAFDGDAGEGDGSGWPRLGLSVPGARRGPGL